MSDTSVLDVVKEFLERRGELPESRDELLSYRYLENGHIDSFGMVQLVMTLEDEFGIELKQNELQKLEQISIVGGLVELVEQRISEAEKLLEG